MEANIFRMHASVADEQNQKVIRILSLNTEEVIQVNDGFPVTQKWTLMLHDTKRDGIWGAGGREIKLYYVGLMVWHVKKRLFQGKSVAINMAKPSR